MTPVVTLVRLEPLAVRVVVPAEKPVIFAETELVAPVFIVTVVGTCATAGSLLVMFTVIGVTAVWLPL